VPRRGKKEYTWRKNMTVNKLQAVVEAVPTTDKQGVTTYTSLIKMNDDPLDVDKLTIHRIPGYSCASKAMSSGIAWLYANEEFGYHGE
jgi:hypothetical protein